MVNTAFSRAPGTEEACTLIRAPPWRLKRLSQVFLARKQACTSLTRPPQWCKLPTSSFLTLNRLARVSQDLHSVQNCFLNLSWYLNRPARASAHLLGGENGNVTPFPHLKRIIWASQGLHTGVNCFLDLSSHTDRLA